jgi:hypothetical protein
MGLASRAMQAFKMNYDRYIGQPSQRQRTQNIGSVLTLILPCHGGSEAGSRALGSAPPKHFLAGHGG